MIDETGNRYGRLTVLSRANGPIPKRAYWLCICDCGNETSVMGKYLRNGDTTSCGCRKRTVLPEACAKHGHATVGKNTKTYRVWAGMIQRCRNPKVQYFNRYGGRGITVCERWLKFENFLADMGEQPEGLTLDRIDNDGNYCPENCRWATKSEQARNTRRAAKFMGKHLKDWEAELGVPYHKLYDRLRYHGTVFFDPEM